MQNCVIKENSKTQREWTAPPRGLARRSVYSVEGVYIVYCPSVYLSVGGGESILCALQKVKVAADCFTVSLDSL